MGKLLEAFGTQPTATPAATPQPAGNRLLNAFGAPGAVPSTPESGALVRGLESGLLRFRETGLQLKALGQSLYGDDAAAAQNLERSMFANMQAGKLRPRYSKIEDVIEKGDLGDALSYLGFTFGEGLPNIVTSIAGGGVGSYVSRKVAEAKAKKLISDEAADALTRKFVTRGALAGAGAPSLAVETGASLQELYEGDRTVHPFLALGAGGTKAALDVLSPLALAKKFGMAPEISSALFDKLNGLMRGRGRLTRAAGGLLGVGALESTTEAIQEGIDIAVRGFVDENWSLLSPESKSRLLNATAAGFILGGPLGAVAGGLTPSPDVGAPLGGEALKEAFGEQPAPRMTPEEPPPTPPAPAPPLALPAPPPRLALPKPTPAPEPKPPAKPSGKQGPIVKNEQVPLSTSEPGPYYIGSIEGGIDASPIGKTRATFGAREATDRALAQSGRRNVKLFALDRAKLPEGSYTAGLLDLPMMATEIAMGKTGVVGSGEAVRLARQAVIARNKAITEARTQNLLPDQAQLGLATALYQRAIDQGFRFVPQHEDAAVMYLGPEPLTNEQVKEVGHVAEPSGYGEQVYELYDNGAVPLEYGALEEAARQGRQLVSLDLSQIPETMRTLPANLIKRFPHMPRIVFTPGVPQERQEELTERLREAIRRYNVKELSDENFANEYGEILRGGLRALPFNKGIETLVIGQVPPSAIREVVPPAKGGRARNRLGVSKWGFKADPAIAIIPQVQGQPVSSGKQKGKAYDWKEHKPGSVEAIFDRNNPFIDLVTQQRVARFAQLIVSRMMPQAKLVLTFYEDSTSRYAYHRSMTQRFSQINLFEPVPKAGKSQEAVLAETLTHELGHMIAHQSLAEADPRIQSMVHAAWRRNASIAARADYGTFHAFFSAPGRLLDALATYSSERLASLARKEIAQGYMWDWPYSFDEWFAEQTARWFQTNEKPSTIVDRFFKGIADRIKELYKLVREKLGVVEEEIPALVRAEPEVEEFLNSVYSRRRLMLQPTGLTAIAEGQMKTQAENAQLLDVELDQAGPASSENYNISRLVSQDVGVTKKRVAKLDQWSKFKDQTWGLLQFADKNKHIAGLQRFVELIRTWHISKMGLISRADGRVKAWRGLGKEMAQNLSNFMFALDSMEYLPAGQNARWPTNGELVALAQKYKLNRNAVQLYSAIRQDFLSVLDRIESAWRADAQRSISDPVALQQALANVTREMNQLRSRPYFPHERFGDWTLAVRDDKNKLVFFQQFQSQRAAVRAGELAKSQYPSNFDVSTGRLPDDVRQFQGVPPTLLKSIANKLQLTSKQRDWLDNLIFDLSPANSAAKKFKRRSGIAGYSYDGIQAYANYFIHMGSHIARLEYGGQLGDAISEVEKSADAMRGVYAAEAVHRRRGIAEWMQSTFDYSMNPTNEWEILRTVPFFYFLGFNVSSALINLTQIPMVAWPYLSARFGDVKAANELRAAAIDINQMYKLRSRLPQDEMDAIALGIEQGFLDETQASELAASARGAGRLGALAGNFTSRSIMQMSYWSSYMFSFVEKMNRRMTFRAGYRLAKKNPSGKYLTELRQSNPQLYQELLSRGWTPVNASAFLAGRDAVDRTQFEYARWNRPKFMRGKKGTLFAFWMFKQNILWFYKNSPGGTRALLILLATAGLMGLPGAEDFMSVVNYAMDKLGFRFNPKEETRRFLVENLENPRTADFFMHGLGRESFGMTWLGEMMGVPIPGFDVSTRLGMGEVVPGLQEATAVGVETDTKIARTLESVLGAGWSIPLRLGKAMETGDPDVFKNWERSMPTAAKNLLKTMRLASRGEETTRTGATVAAFDLLDAKSRLELLGQALGFTPTRLTMKWDLAQSQREAVAYWSLQRQDLFDSFDFARRVGDREALADVREDIREFNDAVPDKKLRISTESLLRSIKQREKSRQAYEAGTTTSKMYKGVAKTIENLYPEAAGSP